MNIEEIDKWLYNEYGISYTKLGKLHDYFFEKYIDQKEEIERLNKQTEEYQKALDETTSEKIDLDNIIKETSEDLYQVVKWCTENKHNENTIERYLVVDFGTIVGKINEIRTKLDKGE